MNKLVLRMHYKAVNYHCRLEPDNLDTEYKSRLCKFILFRFIAMSCTMIPSVLNILNKVCIVLPDYTFSL